MGNGADRIRGSFRNVEMSNFGELVADILDDWQRGIYHMDHSALKNANWADDRMVKVKLTNECGGLATWDFDGMTQLVFLAHHHCVRIALHPAGPRAMWLVFHPRSRDGASFCAHPTLDDAVERFKALHPDAEPVAAANSQ